MNCKVLHELTLEILRKYEFHYNPEKIESFVDMYVDKYNEVYARLLKASGSTNPHSGMTGLDYTFTHLGESTKL